MKKILKRSFWGWFGKYKKCVLGRRIKETFVSMPFDGLYEERICERKITLFVNSNTEDCQLRNL